MTAAILGTEEFDVMMIDPASVRLSLPDTFDGLNLDAFVDGVKPLRWRYDDVSRPEDINGDDIMDYVLKFKTQELREITLTKFEHGETIPLTIGGNLKEEFDGSPFEGQDFVLILHPKG